MNESRFIQWRRSNPTGYEELLRRRRERYATSAEAREKQRAQTAAWRERQKRSSVKRVKSPRTRTVILNGQHVEMWGIGHAAEFLGVSKQTIVNLEEQGTIPTNHYLCPKGRRWYPVSFVTWLKPYFRLRFPSGSVGISAQEFHRMVWTGWAEEQTRGEIPVVASSVVRDPESG